jgi:NADPH:quinone reductase-like Zn-dependent oxidoreductase
MKVAVVSEAGHAPVYEDFQDPEPADGKAIVRVSASALSHVTRGRASGNHYSSESRFPFVAGIDGTGRTAAGKRVYFFLPEHPFGGMAQWCRVDERHLIPLPEALDETIAAAIAIPGMSSWAALEERARLRAGETVLINGATGTSGRLAVQIAKHLGAGKVIATGRRLTEDLSALGADVTIQLIEDRDTLEERFKTVFREGINIVLDYLWGMSAETLMIAAAKAAPDGLPIRYVAIGSMSGGDIKLPSAALRSSSLELKGSGLASVPLPRLLESMKGVLQAAPSHDGFRAAIKLEPLAEINRVWTAGGAEARIVFIP